MSRRIAERIRMHEATVSALLEARIQQHQRRAEWWKHEQARRPEEQTDDEPLLPDHMCENEAQRHCWRADVRGVIRDHLESDQVYRLGEADLAFGERLSIGND